MSRLKRKNYGSGHAYYLDDVKVDGVTTLIGDGMRKKALENWAGNETAKYAVDNWDTLTNLTPTDRFEKLKKARFEVRDEAARRGTDVHRIAEQLITGAEVDVPDEIRGHVESAVKFLDEWQVEHILTETSVWHEKGRYAGTFDMVIRSRRLPGRVILADWKTSRSGIFGETALQLSAYENADCYVTSDGQDVPMSALGITDCWGIWIRPDGYAIYPMQRGEDVHRTFSYVATVARRTEGRPSPLMALRGDELRLDAVAS